MWKKFARQSQMKSRLPQYQAIMVASNHMYRELEHHGVSPHRLHLVPLPAADCTLLQTQPTKKTPRGRILFVGRLTDLKGTDYLVKAINMAARKLAHPLSLTIGGDGPERPKLERLARELGVPVEFAGWVQTSQKIALMREADLLGMPSVWPEPFGMVAVEAGCFGVPSVAFAVGGIPDWLVPGQTGEVAQGDPATVEGLAAAIVRALADKDHYNRLSLGAWEMARRFTLDSHLAGLEAVLGAQPALQLA
jgi:glycosyltransferase involved in cell wall biosynthesis